MLEIDRVAAMEHDIIEGAADLLFIGIHGQPSVAVFFHIGNVAIDVLYEHGTVLLLRDQDGLKQHFTKRNTIR